VCGAAPGAATDGDLVGAQQRFELPPRARLPRDEAIAAAMAALAEPAKVVPLRKEGAL
jgi:hypothetical protein